jgi:hypothetical protein
VIERHLAGAVPRLDAVTSGLPEALVAAIARATARDPARRTASAAALSAELAEGRRAFLDASGERQHALTEELEQLGVKVHEEAAPSSEDARTLERPRPAWDAPPATERMDAKRSS